jgi:REP element-mobilizing transposase RayT
LPRTARSDLPSPAIYHVTNRGVNRCDIFLVDNDRRLFIRLLTRVAERRAWRLPAYTLMTNHYHLLVDTRIEDLSEGLRVLNGTYAQQFNETRGRIGHLFQGRSEVRVLRDDEHFANACEYIWNNAVRIGLCETAADWPWNGSVWR